MSVQRIVAVGLLTEQDLKVLGSSFSRAYPIDDKPCFTQLLQAIDEADRGRSRDRESFEPHVEPCKPSPVLGGGRY